MTTYNWPGPLTWKQREWLDSLKVEPLVCPKCGNDDPEEMTLYITDIDVCSYYFDSMDEYKGRAFPIFTFSKSVHSESSDRHQPVVMCSKRDPVAPRSCAEEWEVSWHAFDLG